MSKLFEIIEVARALKPAEREPCNNCGWCCLTEVCPTGIEFGRSHSIPCKFLEQEGDRHYCGLAKLNIPVMNEYLSIGTGCDARTQQEQLASLGFKV